MSTGVGVGVSPTKRMHPFAAAWSPAALSPTLWLDAADASTITQAGGTVSQWSDKSGANLHATAPSAADEPHYLASDPRAGNLPTIGSSGSDTGRLDLPGPLTFDRIFFVAGNDANGGFLGNWQTLLSGESGNQLLVAAGQRGWWSTSFPNTTVRDFTESGSIVTYGHMVLDVLRTTAAASFTYGFLSSWQGYLSEVVAISGALSADDLDRLEGYLAHKWGKEADLPADHPFKASAP